MEPYLKNNQITITYKTFIDGWSGENAGFIMNKVADYCGTSIDVIIASNDPIAIGASNVLAQKGYVLSDVLITGQDATLDGCRAIVEGRQTMSVYKSIKGLAYQAIDIAIDVAKGKKITAVNRTVNNGRKEVPAILLSPMVVDKENMMVTVVADGVFTKEQIYDELKN